MRLLNLENFAAIDIPQNPDEDQGQKQWNVVGVSAVKNDTVVTPGENLDRRRLQAILQAGQELAAIDFQTLQISKLESASTFLQNSMTATICPDGQTMYGIDWSGALLAFSNNLQVEKHIRPKCGVQMGNAEGLCRRVVSKVRDLLGYPSVAIPSGARSEQYETLFPILQSTSDGLALLCISKPGELSLFTCSFSKALRYKHVSQLCGDKEKLTGQWWRICLDEEIVQNWLAKRGLPVISTQITFSKTREVTGGILYAAFVERSLEVLYGLFEKVDSKYELKWGLIGYHLNWIRSEDEKDIPVGKTSFITKLSSKGNKIAIAINTYMGVYVCVQDLPGQESSVKLERMTVPLCAHCDYGTLLYYDEECWISSIEWLSEDCYFACTTRCGCLSLFYKTGEPMVLKIRKDENPENDPGCNFYQQVFDTRGNKERAIREEGNVNDVNKLLPRVQLKWSGVPENVLVVFSELKMCFFDVKRVSNYIAVSDIKIPAPENLTNIGQSPLSLPSITDPSLSGLKFPNDATSFNDNEGNVLKNGKEKSGEKFAAIDCSLFKKFASHLPQAEIVLRPVAITNDPSQKKSTVQFKFHSSNDRNYDNSNDLLHHKTTTEEDGIEVKDVPLSLPDLDANFELTARSPPHYMADDEMTEVEPPGHTSRLETSEPQLRPEYPNEYHSSESSFQTQDVTVFSDSGMDSNGSYTPPFSEDENDETNFIRDNQGSNSCMLAMPRVPHFDCVIPFVSRTSCEEEILRSCMTPIIQGKSVTSSTQTDCEHNEYTHLSDCSTGSTQRCRPVCIITQPPPATRSPSRAYSMVSSRNPIDASEILEFINSVNNDDERNTDGDERNNNNGIVPGVSHLLPSDEERQALLLNLDFPMSLDDTDSYAEELENSSRKIWEQVSGRFDKPRPRKNKLLKPVTKSIKMECVGTSSLHNPIEVGSNVKSNGNNSVKVKRRLPKNSSEENTIIEEDSGKSSTFRSKKSLKSILKSSASAEVQAQEMSRQDLYANLCQKSSAEIFAGKSLPTDASDIFLVEHLKKTLHTLKSRQEECKENNLNGKGGLCKFMSEWISSENNQEDKDEVNPTKDMSVPVVSLPNFQTTVSNPVLKKITFSEPQLTTRKSKIQSKPEIVTNTSSTKRSNSKKARQNEVQEFTIGPPISNQNKIKSKKKAAGAAKSTPEIPREAVQPKKTQSGPAKLAPTAPKVTLKAPIRKPSKAMKQLSDPNITFPYVVSPPSPTNNPTSKRSPSPGRNRPISWPLGLMPSPWASSKYFKGLPSLPVKKKSKGTTFQKKTLDVKKITSNEQRKEEIRQFKTSMMRLAKAYSPNGYIKSRGSPSTSLKTSSPSNSKPSSPGPSSQTSSRRVSVSFSEMNSDKSRSRSPSKSPPRPGSMDEVKKQMLEEIRSEIQGPILSSTMSSDDDSSSESDEDEDEESDFGGSTNSNAIGGMTIYTEVMENVPLRPFQGYPEFELESRAGSRVSTTVSERMQRRVSFSDPIAVFKTMSPPSLFKADDRQEDEDLESLQLRRIQKQIFDF